MNQLIIKNISKQFKGIQVLENVTATIFPGKITAFIGPNGAGKTTLFNIIAGELIPDIGNVILKEKDITNFPPYKISALGIGRLFQDVRVFKKLKVIDNVVVSLIKEKDLSIVELIKKIGYSSKLLEKYRLNALKFLEIVGLEKYENLLASELSFGQQKLLSFARLIASDFDILLLDEPIAGISYEMTQRIVKLLDFLVSEKEKSVAIIEHNMGIIAKISDWVYFMDEGKIEYEGSAEEVLNHPEVKEIYLGVK